MIQQAPMQQETALPLILIADDNRDSAQTLAWLLEMSGYRTTLAYDGRDAFELAKSLRPVAVLLAINLPRLDGYALCIELRKLPELAQTMIIAQTGWGNAEAKARARLAGFHHHLLKPVDKDELLRLLRG